MDWWIVATGINPIIPPIPGLDHSNALSYVDVLRRDANVGDRVSIIRVGRVELDAKRWMEDWGVDGTNKARAGSAAVVP